MCVEGGGSFIGRGVPDASVYSNRRPHWVVEDTAAVGLAVGVKRQFPNPGSKVIGAVWGCIRLPQLGLLPSIGHSIIIITICIWTWRILTGE